MIKKRRFPKIFFGWWTAIAGGIIALWGHAYSSYGISALFKPISLELGFSRAMTALPTAIVRLEGGFEAPLSGWLTDRYGPRWPILFGVFLMGLSLVLMNYINSLWAYIVVWGVMLGTGSNIAMAVPFHTAIANWFVKKRGVAISIQMVFAGLSGVVGLAIIAWLISEQGWRMTCLVGGLAMWIVGLPLAWFCFKRYRPEYYGLLPDGATVEQETAESQIIDRGVEYAAEVEEVEFTLRQAMRTPAYWLLIIAHSIHGLAGSSFTIHCIPFLTDTGLDSLAAAGMMVIYVGASIPFRYVGGFLADRFKKRKLRFLLGIAYCLQAMGFAFYLLNPTTTNIYVWFILYGSGLGIGFTAYSTMVGRYFGRKAFGSIQGSKMMFMAPFSMAAPIYAGWVYDTTGNYITAFAMLAALLALSGVLMSFAIPPKPPARITDISKFV
ncbi:MFS transporter [Chloroflexota bacterium]